MGPESGVAPRERSSGTNEVWVVLTPSVHQGLSTEAPLWCALILQEGCAGGKHPLRMAGGSLAEIRTSLGARFSWDTLGSGWG